MQNAKLREEGMRCSIAAARWMQAGLAFACAASAVAQNTLVLRERLDGYAGTADASLYQDRPDNSNGGHAYIYSGVTMVGSPRRALVKFDLSPLPADATVLATSLTLTVNQSRPVETTYTLHRVLAPWGEGNKDSGDPGGLGIGADAGDATWTARFFGGGLWASPGGDYASIPSATLLVKPTGTAVFRGEKLAADAAAWRDDPGTNYGWILMGHEGAIYNSRRFVSREGANASQRPTLSIVWALPASAGTEWRILR